MYNITPLPSAIKALVFLGRLKSLSSFEMSRRRSGLLVIGSLVRGGQRRERIVGSGLNAGIAAFDGLQRAGMERRS